MRKKLTQAEVLIIVLGAIVITITIVSFGTIISRTKIEPITLQPRQVPYGQRKVA
jgi:hypothetical protein